MSNQTLQTTPWLLAEVITGAKSFEDSPLLGNHLLNRLGLHVARVSAAHGIAQLRRKKLAGKISDTHRRAFDRNGFVVINDFLEAEQFNTLVRELRSYRTRVQEKYEGETVQRRISIDKKMRAALGAVDAFAKRSDWRNLLNYAGAREVNPALYVQSLFRQIKPGEADPQTSPHADTFHPTSKMWLFLTDVAADEGAFSYAPGSHRLTRARLEWEMQRSLTALESHSQDHREGSFRVTDEELGRMGYGRPTPLGVPANTLVIADTYGFHARGPSVRPSTRVELWAMARRYPFVSLEHDQKIQEHLKRAKKPESNPWFVREGVTPFEQAVPLEQHTQAS